MFFYLFPLCSSSCIEINFLKCPLRTTQQRLIVLHHSVQLKTIQNSNSPSFQAEANFLFNPYVVFLVGLLVLLLSFCDSCQCLKVHMLLHGGVGKQADRRPLSMFNVLYCYTTFYVFFLQFMFKLYTFPV